MKRRVLSSVVQAIGETPLVSLDRLGALLQWEKGAVLGKLESFNPGMSKKDRIGRAIIEAAKSDGRLLPGQPVVELTSGNTGAALAIVCGVLGHPFIAVMSQGNSEERAFMMRALGARVELVPQAPGSTPNQVSGRDLELVEKRAESLVEELGAFRVDQFKDPGNVDAHVQTTAVEILDATGADFDAFVDFVGTGGSFAGCAKAFKEANPSIKCFVAEPSGSRVLWQALGQNAESQHITSDQHKIQGGGYSMPDLGFIKEAHTAGLVDGYLGVSDEESIKFARMLAAQEGIMGGFSAGANLAAAHELIKTGQATRVVTLVCDSGMKYLSTDLFAAQS